MEVKGAPTPALEHSPSELEICGLCGLIFLDLRWVNFFMFLYFVVKRFVMFISKGAIEWITLTSHRDYSSIHWFPQETGFGLTEQLFSRAVWHRFDPRSAALYTHASCQYLSAGAVCCWSRTLSLNFPSKPKCRYIWDTIRLYFLFFPGFVKHIFGEKIHSFLPPAPPFFFFINKKFKASVFYFVCIHMRNCRSSTSTFLSAVLQFQKRQTLTLIKAHLLLTK